LPRDPLVPNQSRLFNRVAPLVSRRTTRQGPNVTGFTLWFRQTSNSVAMPCSSSSSTITGLRPMTSPSALWYTVSQPTVVGQNGSSRQASELGTLHSTLVPAFRLFSLNPQPVAQLGRNPRRRSGHRVVVRSCDRPNPHAALHPSGCGLSRLRHRPTLTTHSTQIAYSQAGTVPIRLVAALGCC